MIFSQKLKFCQKMHFYQNFEIFLKLILGLIISFGAVVCKLGNKNVFLHCNSVSYLVKFFQFSNFLYLQKLFPKTVFASCFGLITHIIKLFQTVQTQKARLKIC